MAAAALHLLRPGNPCRPIYSLASLQTLFCAYPSSIDMAQPGFVEESICLMNMANEGYSWLYSVALTTGGGGGCAC